MLSVMFFIVMLSDHNTECGYTECRGELDFKFLVFEHSSLMLKLAFSDVPLLEFDSQCCQ